MRSPRAPRATGPPRVEADLVRRLSPESQVPFFVNISSLRGSAPTRFRRPGYTAARQTSGRRPRSPAISGVAASSLIRAGTQAARRVRGARSSVRALACKGAHFFATSLPRRSRPASINAKGPPPLVGKRAPSIYDSQAFSTRSFSSGSISMLSSGMGSDFIRLRPRNSLAAMAAKISAKPLIILTVIASL